MEGNVDQLCPFCRAPTPTSDENVIDRLKKRMEMGDDQAMCRLGCCCAEGMNGFPQDWAKALELWHRAAELGYETSYYNIGLAYSRGEGVARDGTKAMHYYELAAMGGM